MDTQILAHNLILLKELEEIAAFLAGEGVPAVLLKGAALISLFPDYAACRSMEDIDLLVTPDDLSRARSVLGTAGYCPWPDDPHALSQPGRTTIDIIDHLWYMDKADNRRVMAQSMRCRLHGLSRGLFVLPPDEMYLHLFAHTAVHHAHRDARWPHDRERMEQEWGKKVSRTALEKKLARYGLLKVYDIYCEDKGDKIDISATVYRRLMALDHPLKGHAVRFLFLPAKRKLSYLITALFPSREFLVHRYSIKKRALVPVYRFLRPVLLFFQLLRLPLRSLTASGQ